jgi:F-type H+-transporting ATPase subunit delta
MRRTVHNSPLAVTYARSLLDLANEQKQAQEVGQEMAALSEIVAANPIFRDYLADPGISRSERTAAVEKIFRGRVSPLVYNFLGVLNNHDRLRLIEQIASAYDELLDEQIGNIEVDVTSAVRLSPTELEQVRQRVSRALSKNAILHPYVDDAILGGLVVRVEDRVVDASVRSQLEAIRRQLLATSARVRGAM